MKFGIDFTQGSTWRGVIIGISGISALVMYFTGHAADAPGVIAGGITIVGALGIGVKS